MSVSGSDRKDFRFANCHDAIAFLQPLADQAAFLRVKRGCPVKSKTWGGSWINDLYMSRIAYIIWVLREALFCAADATSILVVVLMLHPGDLFVGLHANLFVQQRYFLKKI